MTIGISLTVFLGTADNAANASTPRMVEISETRLRVSRVEVAWERSWESFAWRQGWEEIWMGILVLSLNGFWCVWMVMLKWAGWR